MFVIPLQSSIAASNFFGRLNSGALGIDAVVDAVENNTAVGRISVDRTDDTAAGLIVVGNTLMARPKNGRALCEIDCIITIVFNKSKKKNENFILLFNCHSSASIFFNLLLLFNFYYLIFFYLYIYILNTLCHPWFTNPHSIAG